MNGAKRKSKSSLNAVVQVTVEWKFEALRFVAMHTVLEKENVVIDGYQRSPGEAERTDEWLA